MATSSSNKAVYLFALWEIVTELQTEMDLALERQHPHKASIMSVYYNGVRDGVMRFMDEIERADISFMVGEDDD